MSKSNESAQAQPLTLEAALEQLTAAWNVVHALPLGPRVLHRLFGHVLAGAPKTGGHGFAVLVDGTSRSIGPSEFAVIPGEIERARKEEEHRIAVREGRE